MLRFDNQMRNFYVHTPFNGFSHVLFYKVGRLFFVWSLRSRNFTLHRAFVKCTGVPFLYCLVWIRIKKKTILGLLFLGVRIYIYSYKHSLILWEANWIGEPYRSIQRFVSSALLIFKTCIFKLSLQTRMEENKTKQIKYI